MAVGLPFQIGSTVMPVGNILDPAPQASTPQATPAQTNAPALPPKRYEPRND
jgi:hypothetical protein